MRRIALLAVATALVCPAPAPGASAASDPPGPIRIVKLNGEWLDVTTDLVPYRINVTVRDRRIRKVVSIG